jgi:hypothetical protein
MQETISEIASLLPMDTFLKKYRKREFRKDVPGLMNKGDKGRSFRFSGMLSRYTILCGKNGALIIKRSLKVGNSNILSVRVNRVF